MDENQLELLREISEQEFICMELNLYLDTHPQDERALGDYNERSAKLRSLKDSYAQGFAPLANFGNSQSRDTWAWNKEWPWEVK